MMGGELEKMAACVLSSLTSSVYKHHSLHSISLSLRGAKVWDRAGKNVKCVATGKPCARYMEVSQSISWGLGLRFERLVP